MTNNVVKWLFVPITIILIIITLIGVSMLSAQDRQLKEADNQINALEEQLATATGQISSLQNKITSLESLASSIAALEASIQNLGQTTTGTALAAIVDVVRQVKSGVVAINTTTIYTYGWADSPMIMLPRAPVPAG
jgi:septal ring factor EnvC (AmiA/AmiB activator)